MVSPDIITGLLEGTGALLTMGNVLKLYKQKEVKGVSLAPAVFFTGWGWWNIYFFYSLSQHYALLGAGLMAIVNTVWLGMALCYRRS